MEGNQENKSSQMNFGSRGGGRIEGPVPPPFVCRAQAGVLSHGFGRHWMGQPHADLGSWTSKAS